MTFQPCTYQILSLGSTINAVSYECLVPAKDLSTITLEKKVEQASWPIFSQYHQVATEKLPILISGAGIAGLALANAINNMNEELEPSQRIPYIIIERDEKSDARNQGYGLTFLPETLAYIKQPNVLPSLSNRVVNLSDGYETRSHTGELISLDFKEDEAQLKNVICRGEVRNAFLDKVGKEKVVWGTMVTSFEKTEAGILVHLMSKGEEKTLLVANLIAADGVNSKIREMVVKDTKHYLGVIGVYGRLPNIAAAEHLKHEFQVDDDKGWRLFSKPYNVENYNWQMFFPWNAKRPILDNTQMLHHIVSKITAQGWDSKYIDLVKDTDPETMRSGLLYDRDPISQLQNAGAVTFVGDSAHPVSPYKGRGANMGLLGVQVFTQIGKEAVTKAAKAGKEVDWAEVNRLYEAKHWPRAGKVQTSCRESVLEHHFAQTKSLTKSES